MLTTLVTVVIVLIIAGLLVYLIETYLPLGMPFKLAIRAVVIIGLLVWLLHLLGLWGL